jgi:uncharacterized membrane protein YfcA
MSPEFAVTTETYLIILPIVFLAGLIDAIAGGGGLLSVPGYLATGMPPSFVLGTNKFSAAFGTTVSAVRFFKHKIIDLPVAAKCAGFALVGSHLGARAALFIDQGFLKYALIVVIPLVTMVTLRKPHLGAVSHKDDVKPWIKKIAAPSIATGIGFYDGFFGPGTGSFLMLFFAWILRYDFATANGNTKVVNLATNVAALLTFMHGGAVLYQVGIPAALANIAGNLVGSRLVIRRGIRIVRPVFIGVLTLLFCKILVDLI